MTGALAAVRTLREDGGCENWRNVTRAATKFNAAFGNQNFTDERLLPDREFAQSEDRCWPLW